MPDLVPLQMLAVGLIFLWSGLVRWGIGFGGAAVVIDGIRGDPSYRWWERPYWEYLCQALHG